MDSSSQLFFDMQFKVFKFVAYIIFVLLFSTDLQIW